MKLARMVLVATVPGMIIGLLFCVLAAITNNPFGSRTTGDSIMASFIVMQQASWPLELITGDLVYRLRQSTDSGFVQMSFLYGQVILNWVLISSVLVTAGKLLRRSSAAEPA